MSTNYIAPLDNKQTEQVGVFIAAEKSHTVEINAIAAAEVLQASAYAAKHLHQLLEIIEKTEKRPSTDLAGVAAIEVISWADDLQSLSDEQYLLSSDETSLFSIAEKLAGASAGLNNIAIYFNAISELAKAESSGSLTTQIARAGYGLAGDTAQHLAGVAGAFYDAHKDKGGMNEH